MRKLERGRKDCLNSGLSRECFSEILQNFHSAGYMPSARSILLLLLAVASLRSKNLEKSSHDTSPYLFTFKFANLSHRDPYLENVKFDSARFDAALLSCQGGRGLNFASLYSQLLADAKLLPSPLTIPHPLRRF